MIGAGEHPPPPFPQGKLFYLRYSVNFMNGLTFFAIKILHITTRTTISPVPWWRIQEPKGTINVGVIGSPPFPWGGYKQYRLLSMQNTNFDVK